MSDFLATSVRDWEDLAELDPYWAILSDSSKRYGKWSPEEFFLTGAQEISDLMQMAVELRHPRERRLSLDFGCGIGRLTRALGSHFEKSMGIDISDEMIRRARKLNGDQTNCEFQQASGLERFSGESFDLIYTGRVLQHVPTREAIKHYISELVRVLKPGGLLAMQIPSSIRCGRWFNLVGGCMGY